MQQVIAAPAPAVLPAQVLVLTTPAVESVLQKHVKVLAVPNAPEPVRIPTALASAHTDVINFAIQTVKAPAPEQLVSLAAAMTAQVLANIHVLLLVQQTKRARSGMIRTKILQRSVLILTELLV